jgi:uncharacterized membrane protein
MNNKKIIKLILTFFFGAFMVFGGVNHFLKPEMYFPFFPDFLPKEILNFAAGAMEIVIGVGAFIPKFRKAACLGILILMLMFLPLHIWDVFRDNPAIGTHEAALVRLPIQFLFIAWAWFIYKD